MAGSKPDFIAYTVREFEGEGGEQKGRWLEIGAAWATKDGNGYRITLDAVPVNGRIVLMKPKAKD
jgi:hypothetical protein